MSSAQRLGNKRNNFCIAGEIAVFSSDGNWFRGGFLFQLRGRRWVLLDPESDDIGEEEVDFCMKAFREMSLLWCGGRRCGICPEGCFASY